MEESILKCCLCFSESKLIILSDGLKTLIPQLLSIQLQIPDKNEPHLICSTCYDSINEFENFKKRIRRIQRRSRAQKVQEKDAAKCKVQKADSDKELRKQTIDSPRDTPVTASTKYVEPEELKFISESDARLVQANTVSESSVKSKPAENEIQSPSLEKKNENAFEEPTSSIFVCDQCSYHSCRPKEFSRHVRSHGHLTSLQRICSLCSHVCNSVAELFTHRKEMHPENPILFKCSVCDETFATKMEANVHKDAVHNLKSKRNFRCKTCNGNFIDKITRQKHQCRRKPFRCPWECGRRFETVLEVKKHHRSCRPGSTIYTCSRCKKKLCSLQSLKNHDKLCAVRYKLAYPDQNVGRIGKTHDERPSTKETPQPVQSSEEEESCNEEETGGENGSRKTAGSFMCKKCCEEFPTVSALETHFTNCRGDYSNAKKCFCGTIFLTDKSLELHKLTVHRISAATQPERKDSSENSSSESDSSDDQESNESKPVPINVSSKFVRNEVDAKPGSRFSPASTQNGRPVDDGQNKDLSLGESQLSGHLPKREPLDDDADSGNVSNSLAPIVSVNENEQFYTDDPSFASNQGWYYGRVQIRAPYERRFDRRWGPTPRPNWGPRFDRDHQRRYNGRFPNRGKHRP